MCVDPAPPYKHVHYVVDQDMEDRSLTIAREEEVVLGSNVAVCAAALPRGVRKDRQRCCPAVVGSTGERDARTAAEAASSGGDSDCRNMPDSLRAWAAHDHFDTSTLQSCSFDVSDRSLRKFLHTMKLSFMASCTPPSTVRPEAEVRDYVKARPSLWCFRMFFACDGCRKSKIFPRHGEVPHHTAADKKLKARVSAVHSP